MLINKDFLKSSALVTTFLIGLPGYYVALMIFSNLFGLEYSRHLTVVLRVMIVASIFFAFFLYPRVRMQNGLLLFISFSLAYLVRILLEYGGPDIYHRSVRDIFFYFLSFLLIPVLFISQIRISKKQYTQIFYSILIGCAALSIATFFFYADLIGQVSRISSVVKRDSNYISPLALSYAATLGISLGFIYIMTNILSAIEKTIIISIMVSCLVPLFLGASRGSIVAFAILFIFYILNSSSIRKKAVIVIGIILLVALIVTAQEYLGSGFLNRFLSLKEHYETGSTSTFRLEIWFHTFKQFLDSPLFGDSLESTWLGYYPHNIFLEVLVTTGILGFIPFFAFIVYVFIKAKRIVGYYPQYSWVVVIFIISFVQNIFSGALYSASWLAFGAGLILGFNLRNPANQCLLIET